MKLFIKCAVITGVLVGSLLADSSYRAMPAQYRTISSAGRFYGYIEPRVDDQLSLAVALFYNSKEGAGVPIVQKDRDERKKVQDFRSSIKKMVKDQLKEFKEAGRAFYEIDFLAVDLAVADNKQLADRFAIKYSPELRLFRRGKPVRVDGKFVAIKGDFAQGMLLNESTINAFVQRHFSLDMQTILNAKAKAKRDLDIARASAPRYTNFSWGPYWGGYWGSGWGWGWGGGWGGYRCGYGWC